VRHERYVIEARKPDGSLDFTAPQPEQIFGSVAITGISDDGMARCIFARCPDAVLDGRYVSSWPKFIDNRFTARLKTW
jgi:hypothetical protein